MAAKTIANRNLLRGPVLAGAASSLTLCVSTRMVDLLLEVESARDGGFSVDMVGK